jgi:serine/threonine-protein kinase
MAVDAAGDVYVGDYDHDQVLKLAAGSDTPTVLPFDGINKPIRMTVDTAGNVYVIDGGNRRVLKLAAEGAR